MSAASIDGEDGDGDGDGNGDGAIRLTLQEVAIE